MRVKVTVILILMVSNIMGQGWKKDEDYLSSDWLDKAAARYGVEMAEKENRQMRDGRYKMRAYDLYNKEQKLDIDLDEFYWNKVNREEEGRGRHVRDNEDNDLDKYGVEPSIDTIDMRAIGISFNNEVVCAGYNMARAYYYWKYGIWLPVGYYRDSDYFPVDVEFKDLSGDELGEGTMNSLFMARGEIYLDIDYINLRSDEDAKWDGYSYAYNEYGYSKIFISTIAHEFFHTLGLNHSSHGVMSSNSEYNKLELSGDTYNSLKEALWRATIRLLEYRYRNTGYKPYWDLDYLYEGVHFPVKGDILVNRRWGLQHKIVLWYNEK